MVYLPLEEALKVRDRFGDMALGQGVEPSVILPRVLWDREVPEVERALAELKRSGARSLLVGNLGGISLAGRWDCPPGGDFGLEVYNSQCAGAYREMGLQSAALSFEQRLSRVRDQKKPLPSELIVYGRLPLMITENCIYKARDGKCRRGCEARQGHTGPGKRPASRCCGPGGAAMRSSTGCPSGWRTGGRSWSAAACGPCG